MSARFMIQAGQPATTAPEQDSAADLADAVESVFAASTEDAIMIWNRIPVRISYKYLLPVILDDVLPLLEALLAADSGAETVTWAADSFQGKWRVTWEDDRVTIEAQWGNIVGDYADVLNRHGRLVVDRHEFLAEWRPLLRTVRTAVEASGIAVEDRANLDTLSKIESAIPRDGALYRTA